MSWMVQSTHQCIESLPTLTDIWIITLTTPCLTRYLSFQLCFKGVDTHCSNESESSKLEEQSHIIDTFKDEWLPYEVITKTTYERKEYVNTRLQLDDNYRLTICQRVVQVLETSVDTIRSSCVSSSNNHPQEKAVQTKKTIFQRCEGLE